MMEDMERLMDKGDKADLNKMKGAAVQLPVLHDSSLLTQNPVDL